MTLRQKDWDLNWPMPVNPCQKNSVSTRIGLHGEPLCAAGYEASRQTLSPTLDFRTPRHRSWWLRRLLHSDITVGSRDTIYISNHLPSFADSHLALWTRVLSYFDFHDNLWLSIYALCRHDLDKTKWTPTPNRLCGSFPHAG